MLVLEHRGRRPAEDGLLSIPTHHGSNGSAWNVPARDRLVGMCEGVEDARCQWRRCASQYLGEPESGNRANLIDMRAPSRSSIASSDHPRVDRVTWHSGEDWTSTSPRYVYPSGWRPRGARPSKGSHRAPCSRVSVRTDVSGRRESIRAANSRLTRHPPPVLKRSMVLPWNLGEWVAYS
jgi:hypothetical protein